MKVLRWWRFCFGQAQVPIKSQEPMTSRARVSIVTIITLLYGLASTAAFATDTLPERIADQEFWRLIRTLSEGKRRKNYRNAASSGGPQNLVSHQYLLHRSLRWIF